MRKVVLASKSPRRNELLKKIIDDFEIDVSNNEETIPTSISMKQVPRYLSIKKANEVYRRHKDCLVIAADTIVICNNEILGKPKDEADIRRMITMLSDNTHFVITGVCIKSIDLNKSFSCVSKVTFRKLSEEEIVNYCKLQTVYDKAGAYAIQGEAGQYITKLDGDYYNVMGFPIDKIKKYLK